jgi:hypothetical protein
MPFIRCRLPGPQLPAHTANDPVRCASAPAAKAPLLHGVPKPKRSPYWYEMQSVMPLRESLATPKTRFTPAAISVSTNNSPTVFLAIVSVFSSFNYPNELYGLKHIKCQSFILDRFCLSIRRLSARIDARTWRNQAFAVTNFCTLPTVNFCHVRSLARNRCEKLGSHQPGFWIRAPAERQFLTSPALPALTLKDRNW